MEGLLMPDRSAPLAVAAQGSEVTASLDSLFGASPLDADDIPNLVVVVPEAAPPVIVRVGSAHDFQRLLCAASANSWVLPFSGRALDLLVRTAEVHLRGSASPVYRAAPSLPFQALAPISIVEFLESHSGA
jgi:hypothetical protein